VRIVAPEGFTVEAVSENVLAGNAMSRRASYMCGNLLSPSPTGQVGAGLGKTTSTGTIVLALTDLDERHHLELPNGVLHNRPATDDDLAVARATITTTRAWLHRVLLAEDPAAALRPRSAPSRGRPRAARGPVPPRRRHGDRPHRACGRRRAGGTCWC